MMTTKEFLELFEHSDPDEPVAFEFVQENQTRVWLECKDTYSQAGGRMTVVLFVRERHENGVVVPYKTRESRSRPLEKW